MCYAVRRPPGTSLGDVGSRISLLRCVDLSPVTHIVHTVGKGMKKQLLQPSIAVIIMQPLSTVAIAPQDNAAARRRILVRIDVMKTCIESVRCGITVKRMR